MPSAEASSPQRNRRYLAALAGLMIISATRLDSAFSQDSCPVNWGAPVSLETGDLPHGTVVGDWNSDGFPDLAVAGLVSVRVFLGTGSTPLSPNSFGPSNSVAVNGPLFAITAARINEDLALDLVTANQANGEITVLLGNGSGGFGPGGHAFPSALRAFDVVAADFDQDGRMDLAVSDNDCSAGGVAVLLALPPTTPGIPRFAPPVRYALGCNAAQVATADFNADTYPDIAVQIYTTGQLVTLINTGGSGFAPGPTFSGLSGAWDVRAADVDEDGIVDLLAGSNSGATIFWGRGVDGIGEGTFEAGEVLLYGPHPMVAVGDHDADGDPDIVAGGGANNVFKLLRQVSPRVFSAAADFVTAPLAYSPRFADFDSDGREDLLVARYANRSADVFKSVCQPAPPPPPPAVTGPLAGEWEAQGVPIASGVLDQTLAAVVADGVGGAFVVWSEGGAGAPGVIKAQHLGSNGERLWGPSGLRVCGGSLPQQAPSAIGDDAGGLFVSWLTDQTGARMRYLQRLLPQGVPAPGWPDCGRAVGARPNVASRWNGFQPAGLALDDAGGVYVAQPEQLDPPDFSLRAYRFTAAGAIHPQWPASGVEVVSGYSVSFGSSIPVRAQLVRNGNGVTVAVTREFYDTIEGRRVEDYTSIYALTSSGIVTGRGSISQQLTTMPLLSSTSSGAATLGYTTQVELESNVRVLGLGPDGAVHWNVLLGPGQAPAVSAPRATAATDGAFLVWDAPGSQSAEIFATRLTTTGALGSGWPNYPSELFSQPFEQREAQILGDGEGGFAMVWRDDRIGDMNIYFNRFDPTGAVGPGWPLYGAPLVTVAGVQRAPQIVLSGPISVISAWEDLRGFPTQVYAQLVRFDQPVATLASLVSARAYLTGVSLEWLVSDPPSQIRVERSETASEWAGLGTVSVADRTVQWTDDRVVAGRRYGYRLTDGASGAAIAGSETWVDVPAKMTMSLEGFDSWSGNAVSFVLPLATPADLEIFDVSGRRIFAREVGSLGVGRHRVPIAENTLSMGVFYLRLTQAGESRIRRGIVLR